jgi:hypothetical protein
MKTLKTLSLVMAVALVATVKLRAGDTPAANPYFGTLSTVSPAELPAKAAALVSQADSKVRLETTAEVVKAAVGLNPAAAAAIVGTIAQSIPEMASMAAATAVALVPNQAVGIAHAAAAAAPAEAGKIVEAVCRVVPNDYKEVAETVAEAAPGAGKAILAGISAAIPALQEPIGKVLASYNGGSPSVNDVLDQASPTLPLNSNGGPVAGAPNYGPPYGGIPQNPQNIDPGNGSPVPTGGRKYNLPPP